ncbi:hypothetical protein JT358_05030 [Micrococcales bacterium 31B]|nr:hypothetical protein [Micrococcales bacterium 31B]
MSLVIDCSTCTMRYRACDDCFVTALIAANEPPTGPHTGPHLLDDLELEAVRALSEQGLVPEVRYQSGEAASTYHERYVPLVAPQMRAS